MLELITESFTQAMKARAFAKLLLILSALAFCAHSQILTYEISWPTNHLEGTFTLGFQPAIGRPYYSSAAEGTYGNPNGSQTVWNSVEFWVQPDFAEL